MEKLVGLHGYSNSLVGEELNGVRGWQCVLPPALGTMWYGYVSCFLGLLWEEGVKELLRKGRTGTPSSSWLLGGQRRGCLLIHLLLLARVVLLGKGPFGVTAQPW